MNRAMWEKILELGVTSCRKSQVTSCRGQLVTSGKQELVDEWQQVAEAGISRESQQIKQLPLLPKHFPVFEIFD